MAGKVAIVTGAARGIGRACAVAFARAGADLLLLDIAHDLAGVPYPLGTASQLEHTAELCRRGRRTGVHRADRRRPTCATCRRVQDAVDLALDRFGRIDVVLNNAGIAAPSGKPVHDIEADEWDLMLDVDVSGAWRVIRAVGKVMSAQRCGSIINVASTAGLVGYRNFAGYVTAKHALVGLSKAAALDLAPFKVRVNALCPGSVRDDPAVEGRMLSEIARSLDVPVAEHEQTFVAAQPMNALDRAGRRRRRRAVAGLGRVPAGHRQRGVRGRRVHQPMTVDLPNLPAGCRQAGPAPRRAGCARRCWPGSTPVPISTTWPSTCAAPPAPGSGRTCCPDRRIPTLATQRRERELARPADPATGPGVRVVLLRYADGEVVDLVVVAHRAVADPGAVLHAVLSGRRRTPATDTQLHQRLRDGLARLDQAEPPDWGLGRPGAEGTGVLPFTLCAR